MGISKVTNSYNNTVFKGKAKTTQNGISNEQNSGNVEHDKSLSKDLMTMANYVRYSIRTKQLQHSGVSTNEEANKRDFACSLRNQKVDKHTPRFSEANINTIMKNYTPENQAFIQHLVDSIKDGLYEDNKPLYSGNDIANIMSVYTPENQEFLANLVDSRTKYFYGPHEDFCKETHRFTADAIVELTELYTPENKEIIDTLVNKSPNQWGEDYPAFNQTEVLDFARNYTPQQAEKLNQLFDVPELDAKYALEIASLYNDGNKDFVDAVLDDFQDDSIKRKKEDYSITELIKSYTPENQAFIESLLAERVEDINNEPVPKYQYIEIADIAKVYTPEKEEAIREILDITDSGYYETYQMYTNIDTHMNYRSPVIAELIKGITPDNEDAIFEILTKTRHIDDTNGDLPILHLSDVKEIANIYTPQVSQLLDNLITNSNLDATEIVKIVLGKE